MACSSFGLKGKSSVRALLCLQAFDAQFLPNSLGLPNPLTADAAGWLASQARHPDARSAWEPANSSRPALLEWAPCIDVRDARRNSGRDCRDRSSMSRIKLLIDVADCDPVVLKLSAANLSCARWSDIIHRVL